LSLRLLPITLAGVAALSLSREVIAHPMPSSAVELNLAARAIDAELTLPVSELALGWNRPLASDPVEVARADGEALRGYVHEHVTAFAPDGRPWTVTVGTVRPLAGDPPDVQVSLTLAPPEGAPVDRLTFHYDVILHRLLTHTALVNLRDERGAEPAFLGTLRETSTSLTIDRRARRTPSFALAAAVASLLAIALLLLARRGPARRRESRG
jgi:hypothetical protein